MISIMKRKFLLSGIKEVLLAPLKVDRKDSSLPMRARFVLLPKSQHGLTADRQHRGMSSIQSQVRIYLFAQKSALLSPFSHWSSSERLQERFVPSTRSGSMLGLRQAGGCLDGGCHAM
jgi:hypothetical protein